MTTTSPPPLECAVWKEGQDDCAACIISFSGLHVMISELQGDVNRCTTDLQHAVDSNNEDLLRQQIGEVANLNTRLRKSIEFVDGEDAIGDAMRKHNAVLCIRVGITLERQGDVNIVSRHGCPLLEDCAAAKQLNTWIVEPDHNFPDAYDCMRDILMVRSASKDHISDACRRGRYNVLIPDNVTTIQIIYTTLCHFNTISISTDSPPPSP